MCTVLEMATQKHDKVLRPCSSSATEELQEEEEEGGGRRRKKEEGGAEGSFSVFTQQKKKDDSSIIVIIIILCAFFSAEKPSSLAMADAVDLSALTLEDYKENGAPSLPISEDLSQENGEPSLPISEDISQEAEHSKLFELMRSNLQKANPSCEVHFFL